MVNVAGISVNQPNSITKQNSSPSFKARVPYDDIVRLLQEQAIHNMVPGGPISAKTQGICRTLTGEAFVTKNVLNDCGEYLREFNSILKNISNKTYNYLKKNPFSQKLPADFTDKNVKLITKKMGDNGTGGYRVLNVPFIKTDSQWTSTMSSTMNTKPTVDMSKPSLFNPFAGQKQIAIDFPPLPR